MSKNESGTDEFVHYSGSVVKKNEDGHNVLSGYVAPDEELVTEASKSETDVAGNKLEDEPTPTGGSSSSSGDGDEKPEGEPGGNASTEDWLEYAKTQDSWDEDDAELGRDELRAKYGTGYDS